MKYNFEKISIGKFIFLYFVAALFVGRSWVFSISLFLLIYIMSLEKWERKITFKVPEDSTRLSPVYLFMPLLMLFAVGVFRNYLVINFAPKLYNKLFNNVDTIAEIYLNFSGLGYILLFLNVVILVPITEELLFRRILYPLFCINNKPLKAMICSSLIFMLAHGLSIQIFAFSILLTLIYQVTGDIKYPIFAHMINNITTVVILMVGIHNESLYQRVELVLGRALIMLAVISLVWLYKDRKLFAYYLKKDNPIERITVGG